MKLDEFGVIEWDNIIGGILFDFGFCIIEVNVNEYIVGGYFDLNIFGDKLENLNGDVDIWLFFLNV